MVIEVKCDFCKSMTSSFVTTIEHKHYCRLHTPGYPPDKDCLGDYIQSKQDPIISNTQN